MQFSHQHSHSTPEYRPAVLGTQPRCYIQLFHSLYTAGCFAPKAGHSKERKSGCLASAYWWHRLKKKEEASKQTNKQTKKKTNQKKKKNQTPTNQPSKQKQTNKQTKKTKPAVSGSFVLSSTFQARVESYRCELVIPPFFSSFFFSVSRPMRTNWCCAACMCQIHRHFPRIW